jgi:hypothetical protein
MLCLLLSLSLKAEEEKREREIDQTGQRRLGLRVN